ncbi:MAG: hypothetical protein AAB499_00430 [Patescibacteria group bacterium]
MKNLPRVTWAIASFWLILIAALATVWGLLPTTSSRVILLIILLATFILPLNGQVDLPLLTALFLSVGVVNFWVSIGSLGQLAASGLIFGLVIILGLLTDLIVSRTVNRERLLIWLILGFFLAQINSLTQYFPVRFFDQTLFSFLAFYTLWLGLTGRLSLTNKRSLLGHCLFLALAVIVMMASVIWANFPYFDFGRF